MQRFALLGAGFIGSVHARNLAENPRVEFLSVYDASAERAATVADQYGALVMIDECHASGFMGATGRGTHEHHNVMGRIDIITGTLGKALGGAMGGFTSARKEVGRSRRGAKTSLPKRGFLPQIWRACMGRSV